jgi:hypothetical protein
MYRHDDGFVFQRVTGGLRKPIMRFRLVSGRSVELISLHFEPGWAIGGEEPRSIAREVAARLYLHENPVFLESEQIEGTAFLCVAFFYSDKPAHGAGVSNYSALLTVSFVNNLSHCVRNIVSDILAKVDWEVQANNDFMW